MPARCFRGDRAALTALRLRRIVSFLRRHRLYDTAHDLERHTGAFFDAAHFRRLLRQLRWADASSYALGFITVGHCSREADTLIVRILVLRFLADLATGRDRAADALFPRLYASLDTQSDGHFLRRVLPSLRSDRERACTLYHRAKPMAVDVILKMAAKCPELKAKSQLPRLDPAYALSLGPGLRGCKMRQKNKAGCIPAHVLACSFMRKRPHLISHDMNHSVDSSRNANPLMLNQGRPLETLCSQGAPSAPVLESMLPTSPGLAKILSISPATSTGKKHSRPYDAHFPESFEQASDSRKGTKRPRKTGEFVEDVEADILVHCSLETRRPFLLASQLL